MKCTAERRRLILERLNECRFDTLDNLAVQFGVHRNTIKNDLIVISCFAPIYTIQGKGGGVRIADGYYTNRKYLSPIQEKALVEVINGASPNVEILQSILTSFAVPR